MKKRRSEETEQDAEIERERARNSSQTLKKHATSSLKESSVPPHSRRGLYLFSLVCKQCEARTCLNSLADNVKQAGSSFKQKSFAPHSSAGVFLVSCTKKVTLQMFQAATAAEI